MPTPRTMWWQCRRCLRTVKAPFLYSSLTCPQCGFACYIAAEEPRVSVRASWGKRLLAAVVLLTILGLSVASDAFGYIQYTAKTGERLAWPSEQVTVYVNMGCPSQGRCWNTLTKRAIDEWNAVNAPFFIEAKVGEADIPTVCGKADERNTIQWSARRCNGDPWNLADSPAVAYTWFTYENRTGHIREADIRVDNTRTWSIAQFYDTMLHELGHLIGLGHPNGHDQEVRAIMNANNPLLEGLQLDDRHGVCGIYGTLWWDDTDYPTEALGAWEFIHPETGKVVTFTLTHIREYESGIWARDLIRDQNHSGTRWVVSWHTHYFVMTTEADPTCMRMWMLYEGPEMFSGRVSVGHTKGEEFWCTMYPEDRVYDVELFRQ